MYFSPEGGCTTAIVEQIELAQESISVQAYRLTSKHIARALIDADKRGVPVTIILDRSQQRDTYSDATFFSNLGMTVKIDADHSIAHNKVMIVDRQAVITGSFNFSESAEKSNAENVLVIRALPGVIDAYVANFDEHLAHAVDYVPPSQAR